MAGKTIIQTDAAIEFAATMDGESILRYHAILDVLEERGRLESPLGEKVEGQRGLFVIRVMTAGNYRFFYCYDDGSAIFVLCGYQKKTPTIPPREIRNALKMKRSLGL